MTVFYDGAALGGTHDDSAEALGLANDQHEGQCDQGTDPRMRPQPLHLAALLDFLLDHLTHFRDGRVQSIQQLQQVTPSPAGPRSQQGGFQLLPLGFTPQTILAAQPFIQAHGLQLVHDPGEHLQVPLGTGSKSNRDANGAAVRIYYEGATQSRLVKSGSSYLSQSELPVTFGVGKRERIERVVMEWPSGRVEEYKSLAVTRAYECVEGKGINPQPRF